MAKMALHVSRKGKIPPKAGRFDIPGGDQVLVHPRDFGIIPRSSLPPIDMDTTYLYPPAPIT
ncbi:hypothetical protein NEUTE2DRAFT_59061 [Neurospora tetrasperma FGSC 2509]|nr:hypothetical protein NEUTE2DRAFT_59061 [Neurospora tetrasperma FGSC 2509]